jgi:hypothetical protein
MCSSLVSWVCIGVDEVQLCCLHSLAARIPAVHVIVPESYAGLLPGLHDDRELCALLLHTKLGHGKPSGTTTGVTPRGSTRLHGQQGSHYGSDSCRVCGC